MSAITISFIVFAIVLGGAIFGMLLRALLPQHHLNPESKDVVKMGMGLVATMCALVLGLLISGAKNSYDVQNTELTKMSAKVVLLDRILAHYGVEMNESRDLLRASVVRILDSLSAKEFQRTFQTEALHADCEVVFDKIQALSPKDERPQALKTQALTLMLSLGQTRWLPYAQGASSVTMPLLVIFIFWLSALFISLGLFAPADGTVVGSLLVSALSVSGPIFLILELCTPYAGLIRVSIGPLRTALTQLGR
jgi:hypothetical protein